jgi:hypothetical protein
MSLDNRRLHLEVWDCDEEGAPQLQPDRAEAARMLKHVRELQTYLANNARFIVNYGERCRDGENASAPDSSSPRSTTSSASAW